MQPAESSASVIVYVQHSQVVASIKGGQYQTVTALNNHVLDASESYDPDVPHKESSSMGLSFAWSCLQIEPMYSYTCPLTATFSKYSPIYQFYAEHASINTTSQVSLTVTDASGLRSTDTKAYVRVVGSMVPLVSIQTSFPSTQQSSRNGALKHNTNDKLVITATITRSSENVPTQVFLF